MVTINRLVDLAVTIKGQPTQKKHISGPTGVRGRNSDNTLIRAKLGWEPKHSLKEGLEKTYRWIENQIAKDDKRE
jgi:nucleoside-diphosphate-sugar epimerase